MTRGDCASATFCCNSDFVLQCDDEELVEPKRYIGPQDLIYAQPVSLKPVGRPIAAIPVKATGSPVGYGPPRPVAVPYPSGGPTSPSFGSGGPPYGIGGPSYGSGGPSSYGSGGPSSYGNGGPPIRNRPGPVYGINSRPPQVFESEAAESYRPKQPVLASAVPSVALPPSGGLQQHVHHHYHHSDGGVDGIKAAASSSSAVDPGFAPVGGPLYAGNDGPSSLYAPGSLNSYGGNFENYETAGTQPFYKKQLNLKSPSSKCAPRFARVISYDRRPSPLPAQSLVVHVLSLRL